MAILHVRDVPDDLYERIRQLAAREKRSLSAEVVRLLELATEREPEALESLYDRIRRRRAEIQRKVGVLPSSVELIRADRDR
ncbi:MAG: hypothetical protein HY690_06875 [Chloroflexi bacterium]|nr:hypothetical protein [Chloroflexota bacterium]